MGSTSILLFWGVPNISQEIVMSQSKWLPKKKLSNAAPNYQSIKAITIGTSTESPISRGKLYKSLRNPRFLQA
jgi:hypothetical protein